MAYATINKPSDYFNTVLYTGNGGTQSITGVGFQPDFVWIKERSSTSNHVAQDSTRGSSSALFPSLTNAQSNTGNFVTSFDSDGFTSGNNGGTNESSQTYVAWNWLAGGTTSSNTDGSVTSTVSANTTAGFSIVSYTGTGSTATIGHGLGSTPKVIIVKRVNSTGGWVVYNEVVGNTKIMELHDAVASQTSSAAWNNTSPTSSAFTVGTYTSTNTSGGTYIAYCFADVKGFSKFGKFTSNGSDDGAFTYCGFKPAWIMMKPNVTDTWSHWFIFDNKRDTYNLADLPQYANLAIQDGYYGGTPATNYSQIDMLSNGFKIRRDGNWGLGGNGTEVIYMAFAEAPLVGTNKIPATAR